MSFQIPEADWRQFKQVHAALLERFCVRTLEELAGAIRSTEGTAHQRYLRLYELVQQRDKELDQTFSDFRRSSAVLQLAIMRGLGLLQNEDLDRFSLPTRQAVLLFAREEPPEHH